jgi:hypothetical protein
MILTSVYAAHNLSMTLPLSYWIFNDANRFLEIQVKVIIGGPLDVFTHIHM